MVVLLESPKAGGRVGQTAVPKDEEKVHTRGYERVDWTVFEKAVDWVGQMETLRVGQLESSEAE